MNNMMNMLFQIMQNPMGALRQKYNNIPQDINNVEAAMKYLYDNGSIRPEQIQQAQQMSNSPMGQMLMKMFVK